MTSSVHFQCYYSSYATTDSSQESAKILSTYAEGGWYQPCMRLIHYCY